MQLFGHCRFSLYRHEGSLLMRKYHQSTFVGESESEEFAQKNELYALPSLCMSLSAPRYASVFALILVYASNFLPNIYGVFYEIEQLSGILWLNLLLFSITYFFLEVT